MGRSCLLACVLLLTGCSTLPYGTADVDPAAADAGAQGVLRDAASDAVMRRHLIGSDIHGAYEPYPRGASGLRYNPPWRTEGKLSPEERRENQALFNAYRAQLDAIRDDLLQLVDLQKRQATRQPVRILLFLHGGLNHPDNSWGRLQRHLADACSDNYYPLFVSWRSGAGVSLQDRYYNVRQGYTRRGPLAWPRGLVYLASDLLTGAAKFPETTWNGAANALPVMQGGWHDRDRSDYDDYRPSRLLWENGENFSMTRRAWIQTRKVVPGTLRLATTPLTQALGSQAWNMMVRRTENLMHMEADLRYPELERPNAGATAGAGAVREDLDGYCIGCDTPAGNGVLALLGARLVQIVAEGQQQGVEVEIMLVGHSMGAILANRMVHDYPELPYRTILHMASADSLRSLLDKTVPWLRANAQWQPEFYNLVLHPSHEETEAFAQAAAPTGSLLVWLDEMFAAPNHILDRRAGRWDNIKHLLAYFEKHGIENARVKVFPLNVAGLPRKHGDFGTCQFWKPSFYWNGAGTPKHCNAPLAPDPPPLAQSCDVRALVQ